MFKSRQKLSSQLINEEKQKIFTPYILSYSIHSIVVSVCGKTEEEGIAFCFTDGEIKWHSEVGYPIDADDSLTIEVNYFYKSSYRDLLSFASNIQQKLDTDFSPEENKSIQRTEIFCKHYIDAQFALDNGLYKESVVNFGTAFEAMLNRNLSNSFTLRKSITQLDKNLYPVDELNFINDCRNKVHPNNIADFQDISREDAKRCRTGVELFLQSLAN